ncbi:hypothetical protein NC661_03075 [Aquibacillus koreensis]|uniref:Uncharacterized protein n=1 Tax=Aquibacillus koreensis TaxID=279446 RepID=A0A9X3WL85_9BACI|nr:hypothetical protein [Aquibacillus koreensis]MCT2536837.1 hypothetical protein [Aquibacillus koreensis]MDC3419344.1 hypothetical protein [Aquibacillus koreensis]
MSSILEKIKRLKEQRYSISEIKRSFMNRKIKRSIIVIEVQDVINRLYRKLDLLSDQPLEVPNVEKEQVFYH